MQVLSKPVAVGGNDYYFCCCCQYGPQTIEINPQCANCGHYGCAKCTTDASEEILFTEVDSSPPHPTPVAASIEVLASTCEASPSPPRVSLPTNKIVIQTFLVDHQSILELSSQSGPLHRLPAHIRGDYSILSGAPMDGGSFVWYCCVCGDGPLGPGTPVCPQGDGHAMGDCCHKEKTK